MKHLDAEQLLKEAIEKTSVNLSELIAATALWAHPNVHRYLISENGSGAWRPNVRKTRSGEVRREIINGILLDDNTLLDQYFKSATGIIREVQDGYECCHIWKSSCYHPLYYTSVANLVLLPMAVSSMCDYSSNVRSALMYRAYEIYGWRPKGQDKPKKPANYPKNWLEPMDFSKDVQRALISRDWAKLI